MKWDRLKKLSYPLDNYGRITSIYVIFHNQQHKQHYRLVDPSMSIISIMLNYNVSVAGMGSMIEKSCSARLGIA